MDLNDAPRPGEKKLDVPAEWFSPRRWKDVSKLGPWLDAGSELGYPAAKGERYFSSALWRVELSDCDLKIPSELREVYKSWRPTPLREAVSLCDRLGIRSRIFYKDESASPVFSYKAIAAVTQAWFASQEGISKLTAFTLSGYWGIALAWACAKFGISAKIVLPKATFSKRKELLTQLSRWNADMETVDDRPDFRKALQDDSRLATGCFFNSVVSFNSMIGQEAMSQLELQGISPDSIVGCCGGGTNLGGMLLPFLLQGTSEKSPRFVTIEPKAVRKFERSRIEQVRMLDEEGPRYSTFTIDKELLDESIRDSWAPGLTYPVVTPLLVALQLQKRLCNASCSDKEARIAAELFFQSEGIEPAPEAAFAVWGAIEEARYLDSIGKPGVVLFCLSGGHRRDL